MKKNKEIIQEKIENLRKIDEAIMLIRKEREEIQSKFSFLIPAYILDEINIHKLDKNFENAYNLIGIAVKTGTLSKENGKILKDSIDNQF